jgi:hypothetical protein
MDTATTHIDHRQEAVKALTELTRALGERDFVARLLEAMTEPPFVRATNRRAVQLSENISCRPGDGEEMWFFYSWGDGIVPARHVEAAAERVAYVLTPPGV